MAKKNLFKYLVPTGALLAFASVAGATMVAPGGSVAAGTVSVGPGAIQVATTGPITLTNSSTGLNATYTETVYADPTGVCPGCLDFVIMATDNSSSTDIIQSITGSSFTGNGSTQTDVGDNTSINGGSAVTGLAPVTVDRSGNGSVVSFDFRPSEISPGQSSLYLIIRTDATQWVPGTVTIQDGAAATGAGFGVAPEPNMTYLLSILAVGVIGAAYRRKKIAIKDPEA